MQHDGHDEYHWGMLVLLLDVLLVYEQGVIFKGHFAPLSERFATWPHVLQVTYVKNWLHFKIFHGFSDIKLKCIGTVLIFWGGCKEPKI